MCTFGNLSETDGWLAESAAVSLPLLSSQPLDLIDVTLLQQYGPPAPLDGPTEATGVSTATIGSFQITPSPPVELLS